MGFRGWRWRKKAAFLLLCGRLDGTATAWAAQSTSDLRWLHLPDQRGRLNITTDDDAPGREAGQALAERACAQRWKISIIDLGNGTDFNDILNRKAAMTRTRPKLFNSRPEGRNR
jgi:hypothetical protein